MATKDGERTYLATSLWGVEVVTIASNVGQGADQDCAWCYVYPIAANTGSIQMNMGAVADADDVTLVDDVPLRMHISNTSQMYFYGATNGDKVMIIWFD